MSGAPIDDRDQNADARGWFVPPPDQPTDITLAGHLPPLRVPRPVYPDRRVWPPPPPPPSPDDEGYSTQPFPVIAAPLPPSARPQPPTPPAPTPTAEAVAKPRRRVLWGFVLVFAVAAALAGPGWFTYSTYKSGRPDDRVHVVPAGQPGTWQHVSWTAAVEPTDGPAGATPAPDRQWLKVVLTRTAVDAEGATRHGSPLDVTLRDRNGRSWRTEELSNKTPATVAENVVGQPYQIEMLGIVPAQVAGQVEVHLRPSTYRDIPGQEVKDLVKSSVDNPETLENVLRFLR
ncbi:hypothetical protein Acor_66390 [Acrocarpospora corrugata]|uniref:Uncharacterized protein n=1 Tax=Acrocarpospora corrugata TaxID=35763 RepID=A0A5M3WBX9_9ACTN|nr:hypothetical protein [Acrocarpospora corrugata]GES04571.1 hypothetical protein Acor_66390 [Acrocarpospora corrugata]